MAWQRKHLYLLRYPLLTTVALQGLSHRPEKESLVQRNILPESTAAPSIQGQQKELEKHMRADSLEKHLQARPDKEALLKGGILKGMSLCTLLQRLRTSVLDASLQRTLQSTQSVSLAIAIGRKLGIGEKPASAIQLRSVKTL